MKTKYLFLMLVLAFSQGAFAQTKTTENRPQPYLVSKGDGSSTNRSKAYVVSRGDVRPAATRPRVYTNQTVKPSRKPETSDAFELERHAFALINQQRASSGLEPLTWSDDAAKIARLHSENMANYDFFSHTDLNGLMVNDRADSLGIKKWQAIGENIAYNQGFENPVEFAVERWMKSPKHRDNLLNSRWRESGIGIAIAENGKYYFTEVFLQRK